MTTFQKTVKYAAMALAIFLSVSIISSIWAVGSIIFGVFGNDDILDEMKSYEVSEKVNSLEINMNSVDFTIKKSDTLYVESNIKKLSVTEKNGTLIIKDKSKIGLVDSDASVILHVPSDFSFNEIEIDVGACNFSADRISAKEIELSLGAGEVNIEYINASNSIDIDGGAGKIFISNGILNNLDLDMGAGDIELTAEIFGNSEFDLGVGKSDFNLIGEENDYSINVERGLGELEVDGKEVSQYNTINGESKIDIDGGVGKIEIHFGGKVVAFS